MAAVTPLHGIVPRPDDGGAGGELIRIRGAFDSAGLVMG